MTDNRNERQNITQGYESLSADKRIIFKSIIDIVFALLSGLQATEMRGK